MDDDIDKEPEKPSFTIDEYLEDMEERELEAEMVFGGDDCDECTFPKGYMKRQAIFSCKTCTPEGNAGFCGACAMACHEGHEVLELWTKRNFRCDCGNSKFGNFICKLLPSKDVENEKNSYNHNFRGTYCTCDRPYPDPDAEEDIEMIQCCICEDWFHGEHLGLVSSEKAPVNEEDEPLYEELICQACSAACSFLALYPQHIFVAPKKIDMVSNDEKGKGILQEASSGCTSSGKVENTGCVLPEPNIAFVGDKSETVADGKGVVLDEISEKDLSLNKCSHDASSSAPCLLGVDLGAAPPSPARNKAMFLISNWRSFLCRCERCSKFYEEKHLSFLIDEDDTVAAYEKKAKQRRAERLQKQEDASINLYNSLGHIEKVEVMRGLGDMFSALQNFLVNRESTKPVQADEIYEMFDDLNKKRRRQM